MNNLHKILRLIRTQNIGYVTFHNLLARYQNISALYDNIDEILDNNLTLLSKYNFRGRSVSLISHEIVAREIEETLDSGAKFITFLDNAFPEFLKTLSYYPPVLSYKGSVTNLNRVMCGISGSRTSSDYSKFMAERLSEYLLAANIGVATGVSGKIDTACHNIEHAYQIGVSPFSIANLDDVHKKILSYGGTIVTDVGLYEGTYKYTFLKRNRLLVGLSRVLAIAESRYKSGSFATAIEGINAGRAVFIMEHFAYQNDTSGNKYLLQAGGRALNDFKEISMAANTSELETWHICEDRAKYLSSIEIPNSMREDIILTYHKRFGTLEYLEENSRKVASILKIDTYVVQYVIIECNIVL